VRACLAIDLRLATGAAVRRDGMVNSRYLLTSPARGQESIVPETIAESPPLFGEFFIDGYAAKRLAVPG
jgi:hypothetical protein